MGGTIVKLAYVDPHPVPDSLPATLQILHTVDALAELGIRVDLITPRPRGALAVRDLLGRDLPTAARLRYLPDWRKRWWFPSRSNKPFQLFARHLLRGSNYDALLVRNLKLADYLLSLSLGIPLFFETHEIFAQSFAEQHPVESGSTRRKLAALDRRETHVYGKAQGIIGITQHLIDDVVARYGTHRPTLVAPDGFDARLAQPSADGSHANRPATLLYLGSLHPWKGVEILVRAMPHVRGASLRIVGGNPTRITELQRLARESGCADTIEFSGSVPPITRFSVIDEARICLLPLISTSIGSRYTSPLKLFEYMAMGKAIVVSDLPAIREVLVHRETALLVPPDDPLALAAAINQLLENGGLARQMGANARALALRSYSWTARAGKIAQFIAQNINRLGDHG